MMPTHEGTCFLPVFLSDEFFEFSNERKSLVVEGILGDYESYPVKRVERNYYRDPY